MKKINGEKTYRRFNKTFDSIEDYDKFMNENKDMRVYYKNIGRDGKLYATLNEIKKYVILRSNEERNELFNKGEKITIEGVDYTMVDTGISGPPYNYPVIWVE